MHNVPTFFTDFVFVFVVRLLSKKDLVLQSNYSITYYQFL